MGTDAQIFVALTLALTALILFVLWRVTLRRPPRPWVGLGTKWLEVDGWRIRYHRSGHGPSLVLIHGIGANLNCWHTLVPLLNTHYDVIALDLPGFGQSSTLEGASYGLDDQSGRLRQVLRSLGIKHSYLVGNSMGGNVALWMALQHPTEVRGVAVIAPATSPRLVPIAAKDWVWLAAPASVLAGRLAMTWAHRRTISRQDRLVPERVAETVQTYGRNPAAVKSFLLATETIRDRRLNQRLGELAVPLLILWGSKDRLVSRRVIDELERAVPSRESYVHMGGGHHLQEDEPQWVAEKIDAFFGRRSS